MQPSFVVLADATTDSLASLGAHVIGLIVGSGVLLTMVTIFAQGLWVKTIKPVVTKAIDESRNKPDNILADKARMRELIEVSLNEATAREAEKKRVQDIIDNETQRFDGIIRKEITGQVNTMKADILYAIGDLKKSVEEDKKTTHNEITEFREESVGRLSRIEGALQFIGTQGASPKKS